MGSRVTTYVWCFLALDEATTEPRKKRNWIEITGLPVLSFVKRYVTQISLTVVRSQGSKVFVGLTGYVIPCKLLTHHITLFFVTEAIITYS